MNETKLQTGSTIHGWRFEKYPDSLRVWVRLPGKDWEEREQAQVVEIRRVMDFLIEKIPEGRSEWAQISINFGPDHPLSNVDPTEIHAEFKLVGREWSEEEMK